MIDAILTTEDLKRSTGYERPSDVRRCLDGQGIRYFHGKDGPWTTITLINAAKLDPAGGAYSPEILR